MTFVRRARCTGTKTRQIGILLCGGAIVAACTQPVSHERSVTPIAKVGIDDDSFWQPINRPSPKREPSQDANVEGCVNISYIINSKGKTQDARIVKSRPTGVFDQISIEALKKFRYKASPANLQKHPVRTNYVFAYFSAEKDPKQAYDNWLLTCTID